LLPRIGGFRPPFGLKKTAQPLGKPAQSARMFGCKHANARAAAGATAKANFYELLTCSHEMRSEHCKREIRIDAKFAK
jgi:hypothetical protein